MSVNFDIVSSVRDYLDRNDWHYEYHSDRGFIDCYLDIRCKLKKLHLFIIFNEYGFTNYAVCDLQADEDCRDEVMKYLAMANYGLRNGCFEMNLRYGEVRYKVYTNCDGMSFISDDVLEDCMLVPARMFDKYGNGLAAILLGFSDAEAEISKAEG